MKPEMERSGPGQPPGLGGRCGGNRPDRRSGSGGDGRDAGGRCRGPGPHGQGAARAHGRGTAPGPAAGHVQPDRPGRRAPCYGPSMSAASSATARRGTWALGRTSDALGVELVPTARLRHVAHLGVRRSSPRQPGRPGPAGPRRADRPGRRDLGLGPGRRRRPGLRPGPGFLPDRNPAPQPGRHWPGDYRPGGRRLDGHRPGLRRPARTRPAPPQLDPRLLKR